jgi:cytochrome bd-type quinol oxidase subunit 2
MVLFVLGIPVLYLIFRNGTITQWDEYSRWGLAAKAMYLSGALPRGDTIMTFPAYLPGTALFQFYFCKLNGWREGTLIVAHLVIVWAAVIVFTKELKWKQFPILLLAILPIFIGYIHLNYTLHGLQVDALLGLLMGCAFALYYRSEGRELSNIYKTIPVLALLVIIKDSGILLAGLFCLLMLTDQFYLRKKNPIENGKKDFLHRYSYVIAIISAVLFVSALRLSWVIYLKIVGINSNLNMVHPAYDLQFHATPNPGVIPMFLQAVFTQPIGFTTSYTENVCTAVTLLIFFLALCAALILSDSDRGNRKRTVVICVSLLVAMAIYAVGVVFAFMYIFSPHEGSQIASYERYFGTFFLAMFLCALWLAVERLKKAAGKTREMWMMAAIPLSIFLAFALMTPPGRFVLFWQVYNEPMDARVYSIPIEQELDKIASPADRVYLIFENKTALNFYTFKYDLYPRPTNVQAWDIGVVPQDYADTWMMPMTVDEWEGQLKNNYKYVYIGHANDLFKAQFGTLFGANNIEDNTLYAVNVTPHGQVLLNPQK